MVLPLETAINTAIIGTLGSPILAGLLLLGFFVFMMIFGRIGLIAGTPIMVGVIIMLWDYMPEIRVPFAIATGLIIGLGFLILYRGGR